MSRAARLGILLAAMIAATDQASKYVILYVLELPAHQSVVILPFLDFTMVWNRGVSYGWLQAEGEAGRWALAGFTALISGVLAVWLARQKQMLVALALGAVLGGALGNLYDRVVFGAVADFLDFHFLGYHWYVFNVADAAISIGAALLLIGAFRSDAAGTGKADRKT